MSSVFGVFLVAYWPSVALLRDYVCICSVYFC